MRTRPQILLLALSGNTLAAIADQKLDQMLASVGDAMVVTRSCEGLMPLAEELGIVKRCIDAVAGAAMEKVASSGKQILGLP
jgi:hypothetical protein